MAYRDYNDETELNGFPKEINCHLTPDEIDLISGVRIETE